MSAIEVEVNPVAAGVVNQAALDPEPAGGDSMARAETKDPKPKVAPRKPSAHPPFFQMISDAVVALKERTGSSQYAIQKFIEEKHRQLPSNFRKLLLVQLKKFVAGGKLVKVKHSFKLAASSSAAKPVAKKASAVAKPKKAAPAKVLKPKKVSASKAPAKAKSIAKSKPKPKPKPKTLTAKPRAAPPKPKTAAKSKDAAKLKGKLTAEKPVKALKRSAVSAPAKEPAAKKAKTAVPAKKPVVKKATAKVAAAVATKALALKVPSKKKAKK
ncbi:hypothetical protein Dimus_012312 [Dionaea muscipula]